MTQTERSLSDAYDRERERLFALAAADEPQGEYTRPVFGAGNAPCDIVLLGEAPGAEETERQTPFVGKAGRQLDALFGSFGVSRANVFITNVVKYRPLVRSERTTRNRTPNRREIEGALPLLANEIALIAPKLILTLGNTPLSAVLTLAHKPRETVGACHGTCLPLVLDGGRVTLIPLYHPASGIYNRALIEVMERDAAFVGGVIGEMR